VKPYVKGVLGSVLAILAAFGWTITLAFVLLWKYQKEDMAVGVHPGNGRVLWIVVLLMFAAGFYLSFRSAYCANSK
jgi:hypothetical protein